MAMTPPSCWPDRHVPVIMDASAVINLNGTGCAAQILRALANQMIVPEEVVFELEDGVRNGRRDAERLGELIEAGLVRRSGLGNVGKLIFEELTIGASIETLDDGEAATIALAAELGGAAILDEIKGRRICAVKQPKVPLIGSIEILAQAHVQAALGSGLGEAMFAALEQARMHVLPEYHDWVVGVLGRERAVLCNSLPRAARGG